MENIAVTIAGVLGNLGSSVLVALVMFILGVCFKAGFSKSLRGGLYAGIGLAGLTVIVDASTEVLTPAIQAFAENFATDMTITDVGWGSSGIAFAWPGLAFVILGTLIINVLMIVLKLTKNHVDGYLEYLARQRPGRHGMGPYRKCNTGRFGWRYFPVIGRRGGRSDSKGLSDI